jgi:hypothetical protein
MHCSTETKQFFVTLPRCTDQCIICKKKAVKNSEKRQLSVCQLYSMTRDTEKLIKQYFAKKKVHHMIWKM